MKYNICNHTFTQTNKAQINATNAMQCDHKSIKQAQTGSNTSFISFIESWTDMYMGDIQRYDYAIFMPWVIYNDIYMG